MIRDLRLGDRLIRYDLQRKNVKNINIRIKRDLTVHVSASPRLPLKAIEDVLIEKSGFIISALNKYETLAEDRVTDSNSISVFGQALPILTVEGKKNQAIVEEDRITLYLKDVDDTAHRQIALQSALDSLLRETVEKICREAYPKFSSYIPDFPAVKFRRMKSRWGSCNYKKYVLTFNYFLVHAPRECIEYVVYHEFTHFIHPNHSSNFYRELALHVPNYKELKERLNKTIIKQ